MKESEKVLDYSVKVKKIMDKLPTLGETLDKVVVIKKNLRSLTNKCHHIVVILMEIKELS